ncbi:hypothetical protein DRE_01820 [Drechslerella stenobrocha 248]|uniref:PPM-type phosphatase domain-containing protein n=1 Tax=Drechslerella stenobrocha 248 TaxID=1043628 RepID=W7I8H4_9PEZI|nr:hypothetical protein DRE_01820 [Drechslerella stenobrocha 248]
MASKRGLCNHSRLLAAPAQDSCYRLSATSSTLIIIIIIAIDDASSRKSIHPLLLPPHPPRAPNNNRVYPSPLPVLKLASRRLSLGLSRLLGTNTSDQKASPPPAASDPSPAKQSSASASNGASRSSSTPPPPSSQERKPRRISTAAVSSFMASAKSTLTHAAGLDEKPKRSFNVIHPPPSPTKPPGENDNNNAAGNSRPSAKNTFRVGVSEDKNRKCRRTMEDTHAFVYNFLPPCPPAAMLNSNLCADGDKTLLYSTLEENAAGDSDNGYFAIFDGHAGTFAADWCGKKLHHLLEDSIRRNKEGKSMPELLDQTFMNVDKELKDLPVKNSGTTAVCAVLKWESRPAEGAAPDATGGPSPSSKPQDAEPATAGNGASVAGKPTKRVRMLYTANVGDARIVLCRLGKALRLSYDHKGSDETEGKRVANAGGLILNNRVNGVLAVTRALGDSYIKELVTGHPYTTETVIQQDVDEFIILACDGLWDVCSDQEAVDLVRTIQDPQDASKALVDHALARFSTDNLSCMIVRFENSKEPTTAAGVGLGIIPQKNASENALVDEDVVMDDAEKKASTPAKMEGVEGESK